MPKKIALILLVCSSWSSAQTVVNIPPIPKGYSLVTTSRGVIAVVRDDVAGSSTRIYGIPAQDARRAPVQGYPENFWNTPAGAEYLERLARAKNLSMPRVNKSSPE